MQEEAIHNENEPAKKPEHFSKVTSFFTKDLVLKIADHASASTLSNLYSAFFYPPQMSYLERMFNRVKLFCDYYEGKKLQGYNDLERFPRIDNSKINELCCLFNFLKQALLKSKDEFKQQYYFSGRDKIPSDFYTLINYFNTITEALFRYLWIRILFGGKRFVNLQGHQFAKLVLYKDEHFLNSKKSRLTTQHLNCTTHNLFVQYVTVIMKYTSFFPFTNMIFDDDLHIKLNCFDFHYPDRIAEIYDLNRFTFVRNRHESIKCTWHYTCDIFFGLTVDNVKFDDEYCASQHFLKDHTCLEAAQVVDDTRDDEFFEELNKHTHYVNTNTCFGSVLCASDYADYLLEIKQVDQRATKNYIHFCDSYFRKKNRPIVEKRDDQTNTDCTEETWDDESSSDDNFVKSQNMNNI